ncbi:MAG: hypothetical protein LUO80_08500 [Methylococcaceae bacterium]|nr:hypothetical protein [Methylococcaceae bacterium]
MGRAGVRFGARGLADVPGAASGVLEGSGDPALAGEGFTQGAPPCLHPVLSEAATDQPHALIGQHRDEQMAVDPRFLMVKDRAPPEFGLEATEHGFQIRQPRIGAPLLLRIPAGCMTVQAVGARMREAAAGDGLRDKM